MTRSAIRKKAKAPAVPAGQRRRAEARLRERQEAAVGSPTSEVDVRHLIRKLRETGEQLRFEALLADLSARFINVPADQVDAIIADAQRRVCGRLGLDASALWQWDGADSKMPVLTHHHLPPGTPVPKRMDASRHFPWTLREVLAGRSFLVSSLDKAPEGAESDVATWRRLGVRNAVAFPLATGGVTFGALSFHDMAKRRRWSAVLLGRLELVAEVFANAIARKRFEQELRESEERLSLATEAADAGPWVLDAKGARFWTGAKLLELLGMPPGDGVDVEDYFALIHPDDRQDVRGVLAEALQSRDKKVVEYRIVRPDGEVRWMMSRGRLVARGADGPARLTGITSDITARKQQEEAYRANKARVASAADMAGIGFYEMGEGFRLIFVDDRARLLLGLSPQEDGRARDYWLARIHPDDCPAVLKFTRKLHEGGSEVESVEYRFMHPVHGLTWLCHLTRVLDRNAAGLATRVVGAIQDITQRKQAECETTELRRELAHVTRVSMLGELAASMAHELNQPLAAILSNAQAARRFLAAPGADLDTIRDILDDIVRDDKRAGDVIHRLRSMVQKKQVMVPDALDLNELVHDALHLLNSELISRNVDLELGLAPSLPAVHAGRVEMQQVLLNLMVNAMDAVQEKPVDQRKIRVATLAVKGAVRVAVRDWGDGILDHLMPDIFRPFFTTKQQGLGMGLAVSRSMIDSCGGRLWAENDPGGGALFQFELPAAERMQAKRAGRRKRASGK